MSMREKGWDLGKRLRDILHLSCTGTDLTDRQNLLYNGLRNIGQMTVAKLVYQLGEPIL